MAISKQLITQIYDKYELEYRDEDLEPNVEDLESALYPLYENRICESELGEELAAWRVGCLDKEFSYIIDNVIALGNGLVEITNYTSKNNFVDDERQGAIEIGFTHNETDYYWSFEPLCCLEDSNYYMEILDWAESALGPGYYEFTGDFTHAWYLPPEALKELKSAFKQVGVTQPALPRRPGWSEDMSSAAPAGRNRIMYIEREDDNGAYGHVGWISISKSQKTLYFRDLVLKSIEDESAEWNYVDINSEERYLIFDVKKDRQKIHTSRGVKVSVDLNCQYEYELILNGNYF